ncbi:MAG TPA: phosphoribosylglycinamide synthetase C domain-containing protein, partial [Fluviicola sp.]|nr:phosphoribosylglycinamide synthetase C domain-containing protein [Fluviicola sp.]
SDGPVICSNGGRVLAVTSYGRNLNAALDRSYASIDKISFDQAYFRKDIGFDVL